MVIINTWKAVQLFIFKNFKHPMNMFLLRFKQIYSYRKSRLSFVVSSKCSITDISMKFLACRFTSISFIITLKKFSLPFRFSMRWSILLKTFQNFVWNSQTVFFKNFFFFLHNILFLLFLTLAWLLASNVLNYFCFFDAHLIFLN